MEKLLILGAGQYGTVAKEIAESMGNYKQISFLDDNSDIAIGTLDDIERLEYDAAIVAIGNQVVRKRLQAKIKKLATLIHPRTEISPSAKIGEGCIVESGVHISANAEIGEGTIVMAGTVVGHDAKVGDYCQLKYNCVIPERCNVPTQIKVDCNVVYNSQDMIDEINRDFIKEEIEKNGVVPSFF